MHPRPRPSLTQLRRYRGLWLLAVFALLIKLVGGTLCAADGVRYTGAAETKRSSAVQVDASVAATTADNNDSGGDCLLGEGGSCHCACAHAAPVPTLVMLGIAAASIPFDPPPSPTEHRSARMASLLRPPIAA